MLNLQPFRFSDIDSSGVRLLLLGTNQSRSMMLHSGGG
jgi:hypothetical protein